MRNPQADENGPNFRSDGQRIAGFPVPAISTGFKLASKPKCRYVPQNPWISMRLSSAALESAVSTRHCQF